MNHIPSPSGLLDHIPDPVSLHEEDSEIRYVSPSFIKTFGYSPDEVIGKPALDFIHPDDHDMLLRKGYRYVKLDGSFEVIEYRVRKKDGTCVWVQSKLTNYEHEGGHCVLCISRELAALDGKQQKALKALIGEYISKHRKAVERRELKRIEASMLKLRD